MWTFLEVFICGNKFYVFSTVINFIFSEAFQVNLCFTLWFITAYYECKNTNSEVFRYFKKVKGECRTRRHTISYNKRLLDTSLHLC